MAGLTSELSSYRDAVLALAAVDEKRRDAEQSLARGLADDRAAIQRETSEQRSRLDAALKRLAAARQVAAGRRIALPEAAPSSRDRPSVDPLGLGESLLDRVDAATQGAVNAADAIGREQKRLADARATWKESVERRRKEQAAAEQAAAERAKEARKRKLLTLGLLGTFAAVGVLLVFTGAPVVGGVLVALAASLFFAVLRWYSADSY